MFGSCFGSQLWFESFGDINKSQAALFSILVFIHLEDLTGPPDDSAAIQ